MGTKANHKNAVAKLAIIAMLVLSFVSSSPAKAQGGLVACFPIWQSAYWSYYTTEVGDAGSNPESVDLVEFNVFPYGDVWYGKTSFDLRGFAEDIFSTTQISLYSIRYATEPSVIGNVNIYTSVAPYFNGIRGRSIDHQYIANLGSSSRLWVDTYPEFPVADSFSMSMVAGDGPVLDHFYSISELCVKPINLPTPTPPESATPRPSRTPSATRTATATRTRTNTPVGFTPSATTTPTASYTPGGPSITPVDSPTPNDTGTPVPVPGTLAAGAWVPYEQPPTCGEDDINPCGPLPFAPVDFPPLVISSPSGIPTLTPFGAVTGTPGTTTPTMSVDAQATALATMAQYGGEGGWNIFTAANQIGSSLGFGFGMFRAMEGMNLGRIGVLISFLLLVLLFIVFMRTATFIARIMLFLLKLLRFIQ